MANARDRASPSSHEVRVPVADRSIAVVLPVSELEVLNLYEALDWLDGDPYWAQTSPRQLLGGCHPVRLSLPVMRVVVLKVSLGHTEVCVERSFARFLKIHM